MNGDKRQYVITKLPKYLIVHIKRFSQNTQHFAEKVQREPSSCSSKNTAAHTSLPFLSFLLRSLCLCRARFAQNPTIVNFPVKNLEMGNYTTTQSSQKYNLMASLQHDGTPEAGSYRAFVHFRANDQWYEVQDLHVNGVHPQLISVSESYIQVWRMVED